MVFYLFDLLDMLVVVLGSWVFPPRFRRRGVSLFTHDFSRCAGHPGFLLPNLVSFLVGF